MARCPYCDHVLQDAWLKRIGASIMGKASGAVKARSTEMAQAAARERWQKEKAQSRVTPLKKVKKKKT